MTDWLPLENEMLFECGKAGGEYLDSIGKSDLAALSKEEWLVFLQSVVGRLHEVRHETKDGHTYFSSPVAQTRVSPRAACSRTPLPSLL